MHKSQRRIVGAVLLGGRSTRFGSDKALASVGDRLLGSIAPTALRDAGLDPVVAIGGSTGHRFGLVTVPDLYEGEGPLGGLLSALRWARVGSVLVVTCDLVHLRGVDVAPLIHQALHLDAQGSVSSVIATVEGVPDISLAIWPTEILRALAQQFNHGERALRVALEAADWIGVEVRPEALADVDTPEELERLTVGIDSATPEAAQPHIDRG